MTEIDEIVAKQKTCHIVFEDCEYVKCSEDFFCMKIDCLYGIVSSESNKKTLCNGCDDDGSKEWHKITIKLCTHCWEELLYKSKKLKIIEFFFHPNSRGKNFPRKST